MKPKSMYRCLQSAYEVDRRLGLFQRRWSAGAVELDRPENAAIALTRQGLFVYTEIVRNSGHSVMTQ